MNTPLVVLPGWSLGRGPLLTTAAALGSAFIDLPGYRDSPPITNFNDAVDAIAAQLAPGSRIWGWSIGAQLALAIAARHPEKVSRLLLVAGTASFVQREGWPHAMATAMLAEFADAIHADAIGMLPRFVGGFNRGDERAKEVTRQILDSADPLPETAVLDSGLNWLRDVDLRPDAGQIQIPCQLIHGEADPLMPVQAASMLAEQIPGARLARLSGCAHAPFLSRPDEFLSVARAFLNE